MQPAHDQSHAAFQAQYPEFRLPSREEIDAAISPYITQRMPVASAPWREIEAREARRQRNNLRKRKWRSLLPWTKHARHQSVVSGHYESHWSETEWPRTHDPKPGEAAVPSLWGGEGLLIRRYGRKRPHHLMFARLVSALKPRRALEVGCGNGLNLLIMATLFPEIEWTGIELTESGVQVGKSIQKEAELPKVLREFSPLPVVDAAAHQRVSLQQGDASALAFKDREFDLVFTFQALEQMQAIRDKAVAEMARVTSRHVISTEPFADFNTSEIQRNYMGALGYLELPSRDFLKFGLRPTLVFGDWPHKLSLGVGVVAAETAR